MLRTTRRRALGGAALLPLVALAGRARAQPAWPERTVTLVVPFAPGGSNDVSARLLAPRLQSLLGQSFVVERGPGSASTSTCPCSTSR